MTATRARPAKAVKSTAGVDGTAAAAMNENLALPPPERKGVSLLAFKRVDMNMERETGPEITGMPSLRSLLPCEK
ncbi:universal stress protein [Sesbania bispinosa]|nr:universal stress protein [Sesbania bispinosa]